MNWKKLDSKEVFSEMVNNSFDSPQVLFKHSPRCSISMFALSRMQTEAHNIDYYLLDVIAHRDISNEAAQQFNIIHESPQLLLIHKGACIFKASHLSISDTKVERQLALLK